MTKILIVDDEKWILEICKSILTDNKYVVETAQDAQEALKILDDSFNLVISDYKMPGFNGMWLAEQIKNKFNNKIPVIIMTGSIDEIKHSQKESSGVCDFLLKPFSINDFLLKVSAIIKSKETKR